MNFAVEFPTLTPSALAAIRDLGARFDERVLTAGNDGQVQRTARVCRRLEFERKVGNQPQASALRPEVRRLAGDL